MIGIPAHVSNGDGLTMTTTVADNSSTTSPASTSRAPAPETLCLQLGWSMQRLYRAKPVAEGARDELPDRLPGLSRLTRLNRVKIDHGRAENCLAGIASALSWTAAQTPNIHTIHERMDVFERPTGRVRPVAVGDPVEDYRMAVLDCHVALITALNAAEANLGKAYTLGRALADTCQPNQTEQVLLDGFAPYRLAQLQQDLNDLASALPDHAAKAVGQSMTWWRDAVYMADHSEAGKVHRALLVKIRTDAPELRRRVLPNRRIDRSAATGDLESLLKALPRQGELWRVVLTGEKDPLDLLVPDDYLDAAQRAVAGGRRIAARTLVAAPWAAISVLVLGTGVLAAVLHFVSSSQASDGGKLAAALVAVGGYLGSLARAAMPRLKSAVNAVEKPLWQAALDFMAAEAISIPPVGNPDAAGWSKLSTALAGGAPGAAPAASPVVSPVTPAPPPDDQ